MREILFRGKRVDNGEWVYGYYWTNELGNHFIRVTEEDYNYVLEDYEVLSETVGQYTGLTDKKSKKIFEGDIVCGTIVSSWVKRKIICEVVYERDSFICKEDNKYLHEHSLMFAKDIEIIGNIQDNPELLEEK